MRAELGLGFGLVLELECGRLAPLARGGLQGRVQAAAAERVVHQELVATRTEQPVGAARHERVEQALTALETGVAAAQHIDHVHAWLGLGLGLGLGLRLGLGLGLGLG